jgi:hypothetical protein
MTARISLIQGKARGYRPLQSKLHDPGIQCCRHLAELRRVDIGLWIIHPEAVRQIECLRPEFHSLRLPYLEVS